jgi:hypothetical protein
VNPKLGLSNGVKVSYHSLTFDEREDASEIQQRLKDSSPGDEIHLTYAPKYVNLAFTPANALLGDNWDPNLTLDPGSIVVPMPLRKDWEEYQTLISHVPNSSSAGDQLLKFEAKQHNVTSGLSMTLHKLQGATLDKVILQLNNRSFKP